MLKPLLSSGLHKLPLALDETAVNKLLRFVELLGKWNKTYNLTAIRDPQEMVTYHLLDSLAVLPGLERVLAKTGKLVNANILDVGAGGGVPGLVLAIARPNWKITLIDAVAKKMAFVTQAIAELRLSNAHALHHRIETYVPNPPYDLIISRAFSSLEPFVTNSRQALAPTGHWAAMKGERPDQELADLPPDINVVAVEPITVPGLADAQRHLIILESVS